MDIKEIFHNLISNHYMSNFDYMGHEFSFETVNRTTSYSYCQCACAFEHEFCDYLSASGELDDKIYERVVKSVVTGHCPHVTEETKKYKRTSGIYGIHIAAVMGTKEVLTDSRYHFNCRFGRLFGLDPYVTAIYKENHEVLLLPVMLHFTSKSTYRLLNAQRSNEDSERIELESITILEFCVKRRNLNLLKNYIKLNGLNAGVSEALRLAFQNELVEFKDILLKDRTWFRYYNNLWIAGECCELAIVYNQPIVLDKLLSYLYSVHYDTTNATDKLPDVCNALFRDKCKPILMKFGIHTNTDKDNRKTFVTLLNLLYKFDKDFMEEILKLLNSIPNITSEINMPTGIRKYTCLHKCIDRRIRKPHVFKEILSLGANINAKDDTGRTPFMYLISQKQFGQLDRQILELFIFENPDTDLHATAVLQALEQDTRLLTAAASLKGGKFLTNAIPYSLFGYDDEDETYALNFVSPLLMECGFPYQRNKLLAFLDSCDEVLQHNVYAYIKLRLDCPKSLVSYCRDCLRRHFKGRAIHKYVANANIPRSIKNFILLLPLLKCVPICLLH